MAQPREPNVYAGSRGFYMPSEYRLSTLLLFILRKELFGLRGLQFRIDHFKSFRDQAEEIVMDDVVWQEK